MLSRKLRKEWQYLEPFVYKLVSTSNEFKSIDVIEFCSDSMTEQPSGTPRRYGPSSNIFRVAPDEVTEGPYVRDLLRTGNDPYLVQSPYFWT